MKYFLLFALLTSVSAWPGDHAPKKKSARTVKAGEDQFRWLENSNSARTKAWVQKRNKLTIARLEGDPRYAATLEKMREIEMAPDRLVLPTLRGSYIYDFWQDEKHVRGIWRRIPAADYAKPNLEWETILDLDRLAKEEGENWVWEGSECLPPDYTRCLLDFSRGGKDASVMREFDLSTMSFVKDGFNLPEGKHIVSWKDIDTLWLGTDFGKGSLTTSGYPRIAKIWKRGTPLSKAKTVFECQGSDIAASVSTEFRPEGSYDFVERDISFYEAEISLMDKKGNRTRLPFPLDATFEGPFHEQLIATLRSDWTTPSGTFRAGSMVSVPIARLKDADPTRYIELLFEPKDRTSVQDLDFTKNHGLIAGLDNVKGTLHRFKRGKKGWEVEEYPFKENQAIELYDMNPYADIAYVTATSYLDPTGVYQLDLNQPASRNPKAIRAEKPTFDAKGKHVQQYEARSKDGTVVPYFVVSLKKAKNDGTNPTILYGYGGFEESETPRYLRAMGPAWLDKGGVYVVANIRGGAEFGPEWHQAAVREKRQNAFDDFIAVAEDLIRRGITSQQKLGIEGGSNGGLLTGVAMTQRPELFRAVVSEVPLLDMLRYHKLKAGNLWLAEYGDPEDPKMRQALLAYSPVHNVKPGVKYPEVFLGTSTNEDRVDPSHARKMAARLEEVGCAALFFENVEGGHNMAANLEQWSHAQTLSLIYMYQKLMD